MRIARLRMLAFAVAGWAVLMTSQVVAQQPDSDVRFAAPRRIKAGDAFVGEGRYYPSPVLHDMNGDGLGDIVIGDLMGKVTVAHRVAGSDAMVFASEKPLERSDGEPLKFHNW